MSERARLGPTLGGYIYMFYVKSSFDTLDTTPHLITYIKLIFPHGFQDQQNLV